MSEIPIHSKSLTPSWALQYYRKQKRSLSPSSSDLSEHVDVEDDTPKETKSEPSYLTRPTAQPRRRSIQRIINKIKPSSSAETLLEDDLHLSWQSDIEKIHDWYTGFDRYNQLVTAYTRQKLSYPSDVLSAFSLITNILSRNCGGHFVNGLPEAVLDFALLWAPAGPLIRRTTKDGSGKTVEWPSWSWAGWKGQVNFPFDPTNCPDLLDSSEDAECWFKSEIRQFQLGQHTTPYTIRRRDNSQLRIQYPPFPQPLPDSSPDIDYNSDTLQFWAYTIPATGFTTEQLEYPSGKKIPSSQLINNRDQHCGVIMDYEKNFPKPNQTGPYELVLLSRSLYRKPKFDSERPTKPTIHPPGTPIWDDTQFVWDQEVADFDEHIFEQGPWKVLNVLLIKWTDGFSERVAIGRIHEDAWARARPKRKQIVLR
ncbi:hypothetical protein K432DRAFT_157390 [Lepidopterella palustris CBS 459.81]|uniref:Uncharacterized protein n=1 Tax=Lepidopterella palustris CBS 459.81 TaxID=1314670 RepID=A0A8E2JBJ6_9PEZI|nr:hypothetical protein K432DRAFT_157390 [Lepidopterella palustris CBS 459.81]